jgi:hypothetical protein
MNKSNGIEIEIQLNNRQNENRWLIEAPMSSLLIVILADNENSPFRTASASNKSNAAASDTLFIQKLTIPELFIFPANFNFMNSY